MDRSPLRWPRNLLTALLCDEAGVDVLRYLARFPEGDTGRAIALAIGRDDSRVNRALRRLEGLGVIERRPLGRAYCCRLTPGSPLSSRLVLAVFEVEERFGEEIVDRLVRAGGKKNLLALLLHERTPGEAQLLFVLQDDCCTEERIAKIERICHELSEALDRHLEPTVRDLRGLQVLSRPQSPLLERFLTEGISLYGKSAKELRLER